jgi:hydrogenase-4 component B
VWLERTTCLDWSLVAIVLTAVSGMPGLAFGRRSAAGQSIASVLSIGGALVGALAALVALSDGATRTASLAGALPELRLHLQLDALSAFFLVPIYVLGAAGTLYGVRYWKQSEHPANGRKLRLWFGVLIASLAAVVLAADGVAFLLAWEIMALSAFVLVTTEDEQSEVQQAGWVYLVSTHTGTLALFALFGLLWAATGSLEFRPFTSGASRPGTTSILFLLALLGFGLKAGIVPLHFWLPAAHANAPSHVSALLSGVVLKMGIYGLLRILTLLPNPPPAVGMGLLAVGAGSAVYGVLFALGQHDFKRLLAYHSVENVGIIVMGLGLSLIGVSAGQPAWAALGLGGCLLHVWNHALFKALLFLAAGSVIHGVGTREIDRLGGLAKPMARSAALFAIGAAAICGLPPLNGFVSELLIYVGLLRVAGDGGHAVWSVAPLAAPLLAMAGALAIACFVKAFGTVFLGPSRSEQAAHAHESPTSMLFAMLLLALGCVAIGVLPVLVMPSLDRVVRAWVRLDAPLPSLGDLVPWSPLMGVNAGLIVALLAGALLLRSRSRRRAPAQSTTWDCGYARPSPAMSYTASSFAQILVGIYGWLLRPRATDAVSTELFPPRRSFHSSVPEQVLDGVLVPLWSGFRQTLTPLRAVQQGRIQQYLLYVLLTLCALLGALFPLGELLARFLGW